MIYWTNTARAKDGQVRDAIEAATRLAEYTMANFEEVKGVDLLETIHGTPATLHWVIFCESLGDWETFREKWLANEEYMELAGEVMEHVEYWDSNNSFYRVHVRLD